MMMSSPIPVIPVPMEPSQSNRPMLPVNRPITELIAAGDYVDYDNAVAVKFQKAILTLPPKQQLAFNLRYYDEMSFEEISQVAGTTPSSVKVSYHVAKDKIIAYMNSND